MPRSGDFSDKAFSLFELRIALETAQIFPIRAKENCGKSYTKGNPGDPGCGMHYVIKNK
jgi:hypothetical protein